MCCAGNAATWKCALRCNSRTLNSEIILGDARDGWVLDRMVLENISMQVTTIKQWYIPPTSPVHCQCPQALYEAFVWLRHWWHMIWLSCTSNYGRMSLGEQVKVAQWQTALQEPTSTVMISIKLCNVSIQLTVSDDEWLTTLSRDCIPVSEKQ